MRVDVPASWVSLARQLRADAPIAVLEQGERQLKEMLEVELAAPLDGPRLRALASFQQDLGFLLKYKSYAVKAASPLGYSVFLQRPGEGFSFQRHVTHKTEVFLILDVGPGGSVFLCDFDEWDRIYQREAFSAWLHGAADQRYERWRFAPEPGDVIVIDRLNVVHSVLGCTLAEFATVSTDMVDRLHDQNERRPIPAEFTRAFSEERLQLIDWPKALQHVAADGDRYSRHAIAPRAVRGGFRSPLGEGVVVASLCRFDAGAASEITVDGERAASLHVVGGSGRLVLGTESEVRRASPPTLVARGGDLFFVAPGAHYGFVNDGDRPLLVAEHRIPPDVAFV